MLVSSVFVSLIKRDPLSLPWGVDTNALCFDTLHDTYNKITIFMWLWLLLFPVLLPGFLNQIAKNQ